jgi:hypothetical protein
LKFSPKSGRKVRKISGGAATTIISAGEGIWTVDFYVQEELRRSLQKEETVNHQISLGYLTTVGSGEDDQSLASGGAQGRRMDLTC